MDDVAIIGSHLLLRFGIGIWYVLRALAAFISASSSASMRDRRVWKNSLVVRRPAIDEDIDSDIADKCGDRVLGRKEEAVWSGLR